jgi:hypothetical protein
MWMWTISPVNRRNPAPIPRSGKIMVLMVLALGAALAVAGGRENAIEGGKSAPPEASGSLDGVTRAGKVRDPNADLAEEEIGRRLALAGYAVDWARCFEADGARSYDCEFYVPVTESVGNAHMSCLGAAYMHECLIDEPTFIPNQP